MCEGAGEGMGEISEDSSVVRVFRAGVWRAGDEDAENGDMQNQTSPARAVRRRSPRKREAEAGRAKIARGSGSPMKRYARGTPYGKM